jgi:hypothetical protein
MFGLNVKDRACAARGDIAVLPAPKAFKVSVREERQAHEFKRFQAKVDRRTNIIKATRNDLKDVSARKTYDAGTARLKKMKAAAEKSKKAAMKSEKSNSAATAPK